MLQRLLQFIETFTFNWRTQEWLMVVASAFVLGVVVCGILLCMIFRYSCKKRSALNGSTDPNPELVKLVQSTQSQFMEQLAFSQDQAFRTIGKAIDALKYVHSDEPEEA